MNNNYEVLNDLLARTKGILREEINIIIEDRPEDEEPETLVSAFLSVYDQAEDNNDRQLVKLCEDILIDAGYYRPRDNDVIFMGKDRAFSRHGIKYDPVSGLDHWLGFED